MRALNFSPGPGAIPPQALERAKEAVLEIEGAGLGLFELAHRTSLFEKILEETKQSLATLLNIPDDYSVLFMTGGASLQFSTIPLNLIPSEAKSNGKKAYYLLSGHWSKLAMKEAQSLFPNDHVGSAGSSEEKGFKSIPAIESDLSDALYLHMTSNNTIFGTQFDKEPEMSSDIPLLCDASSDILSRPLDVSKYGLIYAGAQKNIGPAGVTIVIIRNDLISDSLERVPLLLRYSTYRDSNSLYNTPPTSSIIVVNEVLRWLKSLGGLGVMAEQNEDKANLLYSFLDQSSLYLPYADTASRSKMNVTFRLQDESLTAPLTAFLEKSGVLGLTGHRRVGGFRASLYNAITKEQVECLVQILGDFEKSA